MNTNHILAGITSPSAKPGNSEGYPVHEMGTKSSLLTQPRKGQGILMVAKFHEKGKRKSYLWEIQVLGLTMSGYRIQLTFAWSKDPITLPTKVHLVKAMVFPVVKYGCESWTIKKAEWPRIDAFELWCWRRLLRVPWTARRSNQSILKISSECSLEGLMLKLKH